MTFRISGTARPTLIVGALLIAAVTAWLAWTFPRSVVDDAFISARYARNLSEHGQLTWNVGEDPVQGYTGVLMPVLLAGFFLFHLPFESLALALGLTCFAGTGLVLLAAFRRFPFPLAFSLLAIFCFSPFLYTHVVSGMDTFLFAFLLTLGSFLFRDALLAPGKPYGWLAGALLLLSLVRPEGALFAACMALTLIYTKWRQERKAPSACLYTFGLVLLLPYAAWFAWQWAYYGYPLPNPYYVKSAGAWVPASLQVLRDFFLAGSFSASPLGLLALGIVLAVLLRWIQPQAEAAARPHPGTLFAAANLVPLVVVLLAYARSNLVMNFSQRFMAPFLPLLLLLVGTVLGSILRRLPPRAWMRLAAAAALLLTGLIPLAIQFPRAYRTERKGAELAWRLEHAEGVELGRWLALSIPPGERLVAIADAGAVPYYSALPTLDMGALNDEYLAHARPGVQARLDYIFNSHPGVFMISSYRPDRLDRTQGGGSQVFIDALQADARFADFELIEVASSGYAALPYYEFVFVRSDLAGSILPASPPVP